jgi:hypothetical protein
MAKQKSYVKQALRLTLAERLQRLPLVELKAIADFFDLKPEQMVDNPANWGYHAQINYLLTDKAAQLDSVLKSVEARLGFSQYWFSWPLVVRITTEAHKWKNDKTYYIYTSPDLSGLLLQDKEDILEAARELLLLTYGVDTKAVEQGDMYEGFKALELEFKDYKIIFQDESEFERAVDRIWTSPESPPEV